MPTADEILDQLYLSEIDFMLRTEREAGYLWWVGHDGKPHAAKKPAIEVIRDIALEAVKMFPESAFARWWTAKTVYDAS